MKLYEAIKNIPDNEWLDISEVVKHLSDIRPKKYGYCIHRFYVETRKNEVHKFD